jgi:steroid delta-isomerase-like uncharacterized protein
MNDHNLIAEANKALIRLLYEEAFQRGNLDIIARFFSPDFVDHSTPDQPPGSAGVHDYFRAILAAFPDMRVTLEDIIAEGEKVVVRTTWRGTHLGTYDGVAPTGRKATRTLIQIFRVSNGLIVDSA